MLITRSSEYAIELVIYLVNWESDSYAPLHQIAEKTDLSFHFLGKISQILVRHNLLKTYRGPNGGVALARPTNEITLFDIVNAVEGDAFLNQCFLRPNKCAHEKPCPIHQVWAKVREDLRNVFLTVTIDEFKNHNH
ncbi:MAG: Rrf2 family transcriptional regulator [Candidatus Neomarinimicrobiota bacterium]